MDLSFGPRYESFRQEVRQFISANRHKAPGSGDKPRSRVRLDWQALLIENGYAARTIPKQYGGFGAEPDILETRIIAEEFSASGTKPGMGGLGISMLTPTLLEVGTEQQKQEIIPPTLRGEMMWCQGYSEPGAGSDLASLQTSAVLDGDEWVINGQKIWTSTAHYADRMYGLFRTEPDTPRHQGISVLLVDMKSPGIEVRPLIDMTGDHNFNEVFFTNVRVPKEQIIGKRGEGWQIANVILKHERGSLSSVNATLTRLSLLQQLMQKQTLAGSRVIDDPVFRDRLMKLKGRALALKFNDMRILSASLNDGQDATLARMVMKLQGTELRHAVEGLAIDVMGEIGLCYEKGEYLEDNGMWQRQYMYYLGLIIGGGTSQIQKNIISERGLGMPKEPKFDRDQFSSQPGR